MTICLDICLDIRARVQSNRLVSMKRLEMDPDSPIFGIIIIYSLLNCFRMYKLSQTINKHFNFSQTTFTACTFPLSFFKIHLTDIFLFKGCCKFSLMHTPTQQSLQTGFQRKLFLFWCCCFLLASGQATRSRAGSN